MNMRGIALWLCCLSLSATAVGGEVVLRARLTPQQAWIGQRVILQVDVLAADAWARITGFGRISMPGAYVLPPQDQGVHFQETIDGASHAGQRYELFIYPQRAGELQLKADPIEVRVRALGIDADETLHTLSLPPLTITSVAPPGADGMAGLISTRELMAEQSWEPLHTELKVGDSIRRIVRLQAADVPGMAFPPLRFSPVEGLGFYPDEARVEDAYHRGTLNGMRIESVTYLAERAGDFNLPPITLTWWDTAGEKLRRIELPGLRLSVSGAADASMETGGDDLEERAFFRPVAGLLLLIAVLFLLRRPLAVRWRNWRQAREHSEARYFHRLRAAIRAGDPGPVHRHLMHWLDRLDYTERAARLDDFFERYGDESGRRVMAQLQASLNDNGRLTNRKEILTVLGMARRRWLQRNSSAGARGTGLPPLNLLHPAHPE